MSDEADRLDHAARRLRASAEEVRRPTRQVHEAIQRRVAGETQGWKGPEAERHLREAQERHLRGQLTAGHMLALADRMQWAAAALRIEEAAREAARRASRMFGP